MELSDKEWEIIEPLMQGPPSGKSGDLCGVIEKC